MRSALAEHLGVRGVQNFVFRDAVNQLQANVARQEVSRVSTAAWLAQKCCVGFGSRRVLDRVATSSALSRGNVRYSAARDCGQRRVLFDGSDVARGLKGIPMAPPRKLRLT